MNFVKAFSMLLLLTLSGMQQTGDDDSNPFRPRKFESREQFDELWSKVKDVKHLEDPNLISDLDPEDLWTTGMGQSVEVNLVKSDNLSREDLSGIINEIVNEFGHSEAVDLRIMLAVLYFINPDEFRPISEYKNDHERWLVLKFAECQTRDWCQHPEKIERLVWFKAWERNLLTLYRFWDMKSDLKNEQSRDGLEAKDGNEYWRHTKAFIYLATVCNRTDLFAGKNPEELKPQIEKFLNWIDPLEEQRRLRPSEISPTWVEIPASLPAVKEIHPRQVKDLWMFPTTPFPRWRIPTEPISAELFNDLT